MFIFGKASQKPAERDNVIRGYFPSRMPAKTRLAPFSLDSDGNIQTHDPTIKVKYGVVEIPADRAFMAERFGWLLIDLTPRLGMVRVMRSESMKNEVDERRPVN
jgi:hypothetical protein